LIEAAPAWGTSVYSCCIRTP